jgi:5-methylcytosine-specific restriction endonuclease McrA
MSSLSYKQMSDHQLLTSSKVAVKKEKLLTAVVLEHLQEIERRRAYCELGIYSLFRYCVEVLGYSEAESSYRVNATRLVTRSPLAKSEIKRGRLTLSAASKIQGHLKSEDKNGQQLAANKVELIVQQAQGKSTRQLEVMLQKLTKMPAPRKERVELNERVLNKIEQLRSLYGEESDLTILETLLDEKIAQLESKRKRHNSQRSSSNPRYISRPLREELRMRSGGQCEHTTPSGKRCSARLHLQIDHILPLALGGETKSENLRHLCFAHNQRAAIKLLGVEKMDHTRKTRGSFNVGVTVGTIPQKGIAK